MACNITFHNFLALGLPSVIKQSANHKQTHLLLQDGKFIKGATSRFIKSLRCKQKLSLDITVLSLLRLQSTEFRIVSQKRKKQGKSRFLEAVED